MKCKKCEKLANHYSLQFITIKRQMKYEEEQRIEAVQAFQILIKEISRDNLIKLFSELKDLRRKKECEQKQ